jgi:hypothetical protein
MTVRLGSVSTEKSNTPDELKKMVFDRHSLLSFCEIRHQKAHLFRGKTHFKHVLYVMESVYSGVSSSSLHFGIDVQVF